MGAAPIWPRTDGRPQCCGKVVRWQEIAKRASGSDSPRCQRVGREEVGGKWFCYAHAPLWRKHYEILKRIRSL